MFGGLAFLIGGNMAVAASGQGGMMVRVDPEETRGAGRDSRTRGRWRCAGAMDGWLRVDGDDVRQKRQLTKWVKLGTGYAGSLPAK